MKNIIFIGFVVLFISCQSNAQNRSKMKENPTFEVQKNEAEWRQQLTPEQYRILREAGTERPFTGEYNLTFKDGIYSCAACGEPLFSSDNKFESHCGWPSFDQEIEEGKILEHTDTSHGMVRTEILCAKCGSHLGHVFNDGPTETGLRYCVNSLSLGFSEEDAQNAVSDADDAE